MPASAAKWRAVSRLSPALFLWTVLAAGTVTVARPAAAQTVDSTARAPGHGPVYRGQIGFDELAARAVVPARLGDVPTVAAAERTLAGVGWPIGASNATRGMLVTQWLAFSVTGARSMPACWIEVRLGVRPQKEDPAGAELIAQLLLNGRFGTEPAVRIARLAVEAFRADLLARSQTGKDAGRLADLLNADRGTPSEFTPCGVRQHN